MKFGFFDDVNKEYVITTPTTPLPWINYLGNTDFFSLISNTCGGYTFYKDAKLLRLTRYRYDGLPGTEGGKYFYIKEGNTLWNPGWMPTKTNLDSYECRHGLGYTLFTSSKNKLECKQLTFVPMGSNCEVTKLTLTNKSSEEKSFSVYSYVEFCLWNAMDDMTNFQRNLNTGEVEIVGSTIFHKTEYRERRNHYAIFSVNEKIDGFETDRNSFLGPYNSTDTPFSILEAGQLSNSMASGWYPIAAHQLNITLQPGEEKSLVFLLGYCENDENDKFEAPNVINKKPANELLKKFDTTAKVDDALSELKNYWNTLLAKYNVESSNDKINRMVNIWNQYQCMVTFNMSRSASYYESGIGRGMGFRDSCQDLLGFVHLIPDRARERIIDIASTQFIDGSAYHQYQPLTKKGNADIGSGFNDDPLWLIACVSAYLKETGDFSILDETVPYDNDMSVATSLFEHLTRSFDYIVNHKGPHNLPLIGRADWNDCLNLNCFSKEPGESFQTFGPSEGPVAESVFIAGMFVKYGNEYADICESLGKEDEAKRARDEVLLMIKAVEKDGWDGDWFVRAYDANGDIIGSKQCEEGQIYIEPQGFCVLADIGIENGLAKKALDSVKEKLDTKYGIVILQPAYTKYYLNLGEISSYPPGYKENAGIFCHNNPWVSAAETRIGRGDRAFEIYKKTCPAYLEEISDIHMTEPYVYSQMIAGKDAKRFGQAKNSWLTGTAAWTFVNVSQYILGVQPTLKGLSIDPCIPKDFGNYKLTRKYRNVTYNISVENPDKVEKGVKELIVDGKSLGKTTVIPYSEGKKELDIKVVMGQ